MFRHQSPSVPAVLRHLKMQTVKLHSPVQTGESHFSAFSRHQQQNGLDTLAVQDIELPQQPSSSRICCNGPIPSRKGLDLTVEVGPHGATIQCKAGRGPLTIAGISPHPVRMCSVRAQTA